MNCGMTGFRPVSYTHLMHPDMGYTECSVYIPSPDEHRLCVSRPGSVRFHLLKKGYVADDEIERFPGCLLYTSCFLFMPAYARMSTDSPEVIKDVIVYGRIVCVFSIGLFTESIWTKILQANGDMKTPMIAQIVGALVNIALDPLFIFGLFGLPKLGIAGAAIATVVGQIVAALIVMKKGFRKSPPLSVYLRDICFIYKLGIPNILMQSAYTCLLYPSKLKENKSLGWQFVSEEKAKEGVQAGDYYAAIVIPENFSSSLVSILSGDLKRPKLDYYVNEKKNAIAPKITDTGATTVQQQINEMCIRDRSQSSWG